MCFWYPSTDVDQPLPAGDAVMTGIDGDVDDDASSVKSGGDVAPQPVTTIVKGFEPTPLQKAFVPASTPAHLSHRFMVSAFNP